MSPGVVISEAWALYVRHWRNLLPLALVVYVLLSLLTLLLALLLGGRAGLIAALLVSVVGTFWVQGALVEAIQDLRDGRADLSISQTLERVSAYVNTLSVAGVLAGVGIAIGFALFLVPGLILLTYWSLIVPAIVLERKGLADCFSRSTELVRGNGWNVFAVILVTTLASFALNLVVSLVFSWWDTAAGAYVTGVVSSTLAAPFLALSWTLMYYRLREAR